jgi:hypothetical protein
VSPEGTLKSAVLEQTVKSMASFNQVGSGPIAKSDSKLQLASVALPPPAECPTVSTVVEDVEVLLLGPGSIAQVELTLYKD